MAIFSHFVYDNFTPRPTETNLKRTIDAVDTNEIQSAVCNKVRSPNPSSAINRVAQGMEKGRKVESLNFDKKTSAAAETPK